MGYFTSKLFVVFLSLPSSVQSVSQLSRHTLHHENAVRHQFLYGRTGLDLFRIPLKNPIIRAHFTYDDDDDTSNLWG